MEMIEWLDSTLPGRCPLCGDRGRASFYSFACINAGTWADPEACANFDAALSEEITKLWYEQVTSKYAQTEQVLADLDIEDEPTAPHQITWSFGGTDDDD